MILLSICIASLGKRNASLSKLIRNLENQIIPFYTHLVEIVLNVDNGEMTIGEKRNWLYQNAKGEYVCSVDDDDEIANIYVQMIVKALDTRPDAVALNGTYSENGRMKGTWDISAYNPYADGQKNGRPHYLRYHNHLSPMKREIALRFPFPHVRHEEDFAFAKAINDVKAIKTEVKISDPLYHYKYTTKK
jgi:glycosyltransferase involved in cell wall biosynthesis